MIDQEYDAEQLEKKVLNLAEAMERVKAARADQADVVVEIKQATTSRLELLSDDLRPVFDQLPPENDQFEFALTNGEPPRLWIDMTSFIRLEGDRRTYEFVKDTRLGREVIYRSADREKMGEAVTNYVAERQIERERMIEGEWTALRNGPLPIDDPEGYKKAPRKRRKANHSSFNELPRVSKWFWAMLFACGLLTGVAVGLIIWAYLSFGGAGV